MEKEKEKKRVKRQQRKNRETDHLVLSCPFFYTFLLQKRCILPKWFDKILLILIAESLNNRFCMKIGRKIFLTFFTRVLKEGL